ncbi:hypothetical protein H7H37_06195, partial [Mycolicibacterium insubricum]|nr:hypothetical protein [Mycolicibacterium insubricum]
LVRLLTGKLPFGAATGVAAVMMAHLTQPPPRVSELAPWLPPASTTSSPRRWPRNPGDRWPSCRAFVDAAMAAFTGGVVHRVVEGPGDTEVTEQHALVGTDRAGQHEVGRLDVAVNH